MDLRNRKIEITLNGETKIYESIKAAADATGIAYMSLYNWISGKSKPRINIKISDVSEWK